MSFSFKSLLAGLVVSSVALSASTHASVVEKAEIEFFPMKVEEGFACAQTSSNQSSFDYWLAWDGQTLPDWALNDIRRDLGRLISHKAGEQTELIKKIISALETDFAAYEHHHALVDLIKLALKLNQADLTVEQVYFDDLLKVRGILPPAAKNFVSNLILTGTFKAPIEVGLDLKISAANESHPDALLELTNHQDDPFVQEFWGINSDISILLAFGGLMGEFDDGYCNRARQIAREYANGTYVVKDLEASVIWYEHLASLGDVGSAWKVAEYHMFTTAADRDDVVLSDHLLIASQAGYQPVIDGALRYISSDSYSEKHLPLVEAILSDAAATGHVKALNSLVQFYKTGQPFGYQTERLRELLEKQYLAGNSEAALQLAIDMMQIPSPTKGETDEIIAYLEFAMNSTNNSTKAVAFNLLRSVPQAAATDASTPKSVILNDEEAS
ncbi:MAG: hypothetical protein ABJO57_14360 [Lentilitoribacter sp.]